MLEQQEIHSNHLSASRIVWIDRVRKGQVEHCFIFLDAEIYLNKVQAAQKMQSLQSTGRLPPTDCVYVSSLDAAARHRDYACNEKYTRFLVDELVPWIEINVGNHKQYWLCGLSLSGLCAAFTTLRHPKVFSGAICQSPSAWWQEEWLTKSLTTEMAWQSRFWISVGNQELESGVAHPPTGLFQGTCQLDSCRRLAEKMAATGHNLHFSEYEGGHDTQCWAAELNEAVCWLCTT